MTEVLLAVFIAVVVASAWAIWRSAWAPRARRRQPWVDSLPPYIDILSACGHRNAHELSERCGDCGARLTGYAHPDFAQQKLYW